MQSVRVEISDGIASITMDDGKVNPISLETARELGAALGLDATVELLSAGAELITRLLAFPRPVLSVCTGHAYPMGALLLLAPDVRPAASR